MRNGTGVRMVAAMLAVGLIGAGCEGSSQSPPPAPNLDGFVVIERSAGAKYLIDTSGQVCLLMIENAITTPVDCRALAANVEKAREHLTWLETPAPDTTARRSDPAPAPAPRPNANLDDAIRKLSSSSYTIDRRLADQIAADPNLIARGMRVVPSIRNGKPNGFKIYAIRPSSMFAKMGFNNGDTIHSINGHELTSADKALEVYAQIKGSSAFTFEITRRGKPHELRIEIVDGGPTGPAPTTPLTPRRATDPARDRMEAANRAYDKGDYAEAQTLALAILKDNPRNIRMLRLAVSTACIMGDAAKARAHYQRLPARDQSQMKTRCKRYDIDLD